PRGRPRGARDQLARGVDALVLAGPAPDLRLLLQAASRRRAARPTRRDGDTAATRHRSLHRRQPPPRPVGDLCERDVAPRPACRDARHRRDRTARPHHARDDARGTEPAFHHVRAGARSFRAAGDHARRAPELARLDPHRRRARVRLPRLRQHARRADLRVARHRPVRVHGADEQRLARDRGVRAHRRRDVRRYQLARRPDVRRHRSTRARLTMSIAAEIRVRRRIVLPSWASGLAGEHALVLGLAILGVLVLTALLGPLIDSDSATSTAYGTLHSPTGGHLFGTDDVGRDVLVRVFHAIRLDLVLALVICGLATTAGAVIGLASGFAGGLVDLVVMRLVDIMMSIPVFILALITAVVLANT